MSGFEITKSQHLEKAHYETKQWISDIQFWSDELVFFARIVNEKIASHSGQNESLHKLQGQVRYYAKKLITHFKEVLTEHELKLANMINGQYTYYDSYTSEHANLSGHINSFRQEFRMFKKEFYLTVVSDLPAS